MKKNILTILLALLLPLTEMQAATYIKEVAVSGNSDKSLAKSYLTNEGFTLLDTDLNYDADGWYIYLGFKTTDKYEEAITDLMVMNGGNYATLAGADNLVTVTNEGKTWEYHPVKRFSNNFNGDLNRGSGGDDLFLYYTRSNITDGVVISGLDVVHSGSSKRDANYVKGCTEKKVIYDNADCNEDAGGHYVYVLKTMDSYKANGTLLESEFKVFHLGGHLYQFLIPVGIAQENKPTLTLANGCPAEVFANIDGSERSCIDLMHLESHGLPFAEDWEVTFALPNGGSVLSEDDFNPIDPAETLACTMGNHKDRKMVSVLWLAPQSLDPSSISTFRLSCEKARSGSSTTFEVSSKRSPAPPAVSSDMGMNNVTIIDPYMDYENNVPGWLSSYATSIQTFYTIGVWDGTEDKFARKDYDVNGWQNYPFNFLSYDSEHELVALLKSDYVTTLSDGSMDTTRAMMTVPFTGSALHRVVKQNSYCNSCIDTLGIPHPAPVIEWAIESPKDEDLLAGDMFVLDRSNTKDFAKSSLGVPFELTDTAYTQTTDGKQYGWFSYQDELDEAAYRSAETTGANMYLWPDMEKEAWYAKLSATTRERLKQYTIPERKLYYKVYRATINGLWPESDSLFSASYEVPLTSALPVVTAVSVEELDTLSHKVAVTVKLDNPYFWSLASSPEEEAAMKDANMGRMYVWDASASIHVQRYSLKQDDQDEDYAAKDFVIPGKDVLWDAKNGCYYATLTDYQNVPFTPIYYQAMVDTSESLLPTCIGKNEFVSTTKACYVNSLAFIAGAEASAGTYPGLVYVRWEANEGLNDSFALSRRKVGETKWTQLTLDGPLATSYRDTDVLPGTVYEYKIETNAHFKGEDYTDSFIVYGTPSYYGSIKGKVRLADGSGMPAKLTIVIERLPYTKDGKSTTAYTIPDMYYSDENNDILLLKGYSDSGFKQEVAVNADGTFSLDSIPYLGTGITYQLQVNGSSCSLENPAGSKGAYSVLLDAENYDVKDVNFTCKDTYRISGYVMYDGSTVPSRYVHFLVNGIPVTDANGQLVETDQKGAFSFEVPRTEVTIQACRDGHTFKGGGYVLGGAKADQQTFTPTQDYDGVRIWDTTTVRLVGRLAGGNTQGKLPQGLGFGANNLGDDLTLVLQLEGDESSQIVFNQNDPDKVQRDTVFCQSILHNGKSETVDSTAVSFQKKRIVVYPDVKTGEFCLDLYPAKYKVVQMSAKGYATLFGEGEGFEVIDLTNDTVFVEVCDTLKVGRSDPDIRSGQYQACYQKIYHNDPILTYMQTDAAGQERGWLGETTMTEASLSGSDMTAPLAWMEKDEPHYLFGHPVFKQGSKYVFKVTAHEDYYYNGDRTRLPDVVRLDGGTLTIYNGLESSTSKLTAELDGNGSAMVVLSVNNPTFTDTGEQALRSVNMQVNVNGLYYSAEPLKAYVLGMKQEGNDFATMGESINVVDIVRDPYGTTSYAYRDAGTKYNWTHTNNNTLSCSFALDLNIGGGSALYTGVGLLTKNEWSLTANGGINIPMTCDITLKNGEYNMSLNERISTSSSAFDEGACADVYIGTVDCLTLGKAKAFSVIDSTSYTYLKTAIDNKTVKLVREGKDKAGTPYYLVIGEKLLVGDSIKSTFAYSQRFILGTLIPNMEDELDQLVMNCSADEALQLAKDSGEPKYYWDEEGNIEMAVPDNKDVYVNVALDIYNSILDWKEQIGINEQKKLDMINNGHLFKSYSVSNTTVSYSEDANTYYTKIETETKYGDDNFNGSLSGNIGAGYGDKNNNQAKSNELGDGRKKGSTAGVTVPGFILKVSGGFKPVRNYSNSASYRRTTSAGSGFVLTMTENSYMDIDVYRYVDRQVLGTTEWDFITNADDDSDVYKDRVSEGEYIFVLRGGARRNPWLAPDSTMVCIDHTTGRGYPLGKQLLKIDNPKLYIDQPVVSNVPKSERAVFSIRLANESEISSDAEYLSPSIFKLKLYDKSNPNGAKIYMDGMPVTDGRAFVIPPGTCITKTFEVEKGNGYDFDNLRLDLKDNSASLSSSATFSVHFMPESTPVRLVQPTNGWVLNTLSAVDSIGYYLPVEISGFDINYENFDHVELQYKKSTDGESQWVNLCSFYANDSLYAAATGEKERIVSGTIKNIRFYGAADPVEIAYDLRAVSFCRLGTGFVSKASEVASGLKDTRCPQVFGKPKPTDGILSYEDVIALPFNENIAFNNLNAVSNFQIQGYTNNSDIDHKVSVRFQDVDENDTDYTYPGAAFAVSAVERPLAGRDFSIDMMAKIENKQKAAFLYLQEMIPDMVDGAFYFGYSPLDDCLFAYAGNARFFSDKLSPLGLHVDDVMTHVGMTYAAADSTLHFFVGDKLLDAECQDGHLKPVCQASGKVVLGYGLIGNMTDVRLWGKTLDAYEIANKYGKRLSDDETGVIAYWPMDEGSGTQVFDKAGGADLTFRGCAWETPAGYSLRLEGTPVRLSKIEKFQRDAAADYSLSFWFRSEELKSDSVALFRAGADALDEAGYGKLWIGFKNEALVCRSNGVEHTMSDGHYADRQWHRFSLIVDHAQNVASMYIDQNLKAEFKASEMDGVANDRILLGDDTFYGNIDELSFWHLALPFSYIQEMYNTALLGTEMELQYYLPFEMDRQNDQATMYTDFSPYNMKKTSTGTYDLTQPMLDLSAVKSDNGQHAPIRSNTGLENFLFDWVCTDNELQIDIKKADSEINHQQVYLTVRGVEDNAGNTMVQPQMWSVYVDRNVLTWNEKTNDVHLTYGRDTTFVVKWQNVSGKSISYTITENSRWLTLSQTMGSVAPREEKELEIEISNTLSPGNYSAMVYLTDDNGLSSPMTLNLTVEAEQPIWVPASGEKYSQSMQLVGQVYTKDSYGIECIDTDKRDLVGVFCGGVCVGVSNIVPQGAAGKGEDSNIYLNIRGTSNMSTAKDILEFRLWDASKGIISILNPDDICFEANKVVGVAPDAPVQFHISDFQVQEISLKEGWNWVSFNIEPLTKMGVSTLFLDNDAFSNNDVFQHVGNSFGTYYESIKWSSGNKIEIAYSHVYLMYMHKPGVVKVKGRSIKDKDRVAHINANSWNELPYLLEVAQPIQVALSDYPLPFQSDASKATEGDWIKSHDEFAVATSTGWVGSLQTLRPGVGYFLYHKGDSCDIKYTNTRQDFAGTLGGGKDDDSESASNAARAPYTRSGAESGPSANRYASAMPAILFFAEESQYAEGDLVVAYADGEEVGHAECTSLKDGMQRYFLMINAREDAQIQFALVRGGEVIAVTSTPVAFHGDGMLGTLEQPYLLDFLDADVNGDIYDLMGRRYDTSTSLHGVFIRGNKKVLELK